MFAIGIGYAGSLAGSLLLARCFTTGRSRPLSLFGRSEFLGIKRLGELIVVFFVSIAGHDGDEAANLL